MKVVLLQDVPKHGKNGDVVNVSDGYAKNYLFPKKLAKLMNSQAQNELKTKEAAKEYHEEMSRQKAIDVKEMINGKSVVLSLKHGENGKLYGAVKTKAVAEKIKENYGVEVDKKKITFVNMENSTIKDSGVYKIKLRLFRDVEAVMELIVE